MGSDEKNLILLMGMKHSGKSSVGRMLARDLVWKFYDLDQKLERIADPSGRLSCRKIYGQEGKAAFREYELKAARLVVRLANNTAAVCALGGGTIENEEAMTVLAESGLFVYIEEAAEVLYRRIRRKGIPPFLDPAAPRQSFEKLYQRRTALYEQQADLTVEAAGRNQREICADIINQLEENGYGR